MADLTTLPLQDNYQSTLSQSRNGATGTIYVNTPPSFTFPAGKKCYIVVNPEKSNMQVARISAYDARLKTITVDSITVDKGNGVHYTQQSHAVGSKIMISDSYQFREDLATAIDSKVDTNSDDTATGKFADATARDAYFTSPVEGNTAFVTGVGWTDYISGVWTTRTSSSNANTTTKGVVEIATQAETEARTATGGSGATLVPTATTLSPSNITTITPATGDKLSFADVSASNVFGSATLQTLCDVGRPLATNAQAQTGTGTTQAVTPLQLKNFAGPAPTAGTVNYAFPTVSSMTTTSTTPVMKTQATVTRDGTYRITFTGSTNFGFWYIQIYKNWAPFGTLRGGIGGATYSEDLTFAYGDVISVYMYNDSPPGTCTCTNYSVQYNNGYIMTNTTY